MGQKGRAEEVVKAEKERRSRGESSGGWDRGWDYRRERTRRKRLREERATR